MVSIFRCEEMALCQLFLSSDSAYDCVSALGEIGLVQFKDLNSSVSPFQRRFVSEVRRCEDMERKLRFLEMQLKKSGVPVEDVVSSPAAPQPSDISGLEAVLEKMESEMKEVNTYTKSLKRNFLELQELKYVLLMNDIYFAEEDAEIYFRSGLRDQLLSDEESRVTSAELGYVSGVVRRDKLATMERVLWRVCRGNVFIRHQEIPDKTEDPATEEFVSKVTFLTIFQGDVLKSKVIKICEACKASLYPCPGTGEERKLMIQGVQTRLTDLSLVLLETNRHRDRLLKSIAKQICSWFIQVRKILAICCTLNMLNVDVTRECFIAEAWIPVAYLQKIKDALCQAAKISGSSTAPIVEQLSTTESPPTFHQQNKFTKGYQKLIDAYGVATYREINPGLFTTTTFPFLFAVMFGDCGHGIIMLLFGLWMVLWEKYLEAKNWKDDIWNMLFRGRYIILMMGAFSIYTGSIYNDMFSKSINVFGSHFHVGSNAAEAVLVNKSSEFTLDPIDPQDYEGEPYPYGLDPIWQISINKINYLNSYKMKISIIIGIVHMIFGIMLSLINSLYFKKVVNIVFEFIPQMIFLNFLFGYLCVMIIYKWINYGGIGFDALHGSSCAPSILILFIDMVLLKKEPEQEEDPDPEDDVVYCDPYLFNGQYELQLGLVIISVVMVPLMLFPKPYILKRRLRQDDTKRQQEMLSLQEEVPGTSSAKFRDGPNPGTGHEEEDESSEIFLIQGIHTIEFVLGCVSHTASYLRLWALSLAHSQLSDVLWMMVLRIGLSQSSSSGAVLLYFLYAAWAALTIAILVIMEGLSAFLHTLRLHWVEFCSKFYEREGYLFQPFRFKSYISTDN